MNIYEKNIYIFIYIYIYIFIYIYIYRPNCGLCTYLLEGNSLAFNCGMNFKIHENMSCDVKNVIYVMKCRGCGDEYIGETSNYLRKRVTVHNQQIRDPPRMLQASAHFPKILHFPVLQNVLREYNFTTAKEKFFINSLKPKLNRAGS